MRKHCFVMLALLTLTVLLLLTACTAAPQEKSDASAVYSEPTVQPTAEPTQKARPSAQELTALKNTLERTENPSFADFWGVTLDGRVVDESLFASHKLTMINIWATYCNACIMEMPYLAQLNQSYAEGELQVIGFVVDMLDTDESIHPMAVEVAWEIVDATGAEYTHLLPTDDLIYSKLQYVYAVPETVFVDSQGNVLTPEISYTGARGYDNWKIIVDALLAQINAQ